MRARIRSSRSVTVSRARVSAAIAASRLLTTPNHFAFCGDLACVAFETTKELLAERRQIGRAQAHAAGRYTNVDSVHHLVEGEVIFFITELLSCENIAVNHLGNTLHNRSGIHIGISYFTLNVLFFISQEVVGIAGSADIVLTHQAVKTTTNRFTHDDFIYTNIVCHQDYDIVQVRRNIINVANQIQELQYIHILLLNAIALRTLAINLNLPWDAAALFASDKVQTSLAILWTLGGVVSMALSRRHASRPLWIGGAVLLGMTVIKLFLIDLGNSGTLERIVSFIGVGLLLLVIGYVAPLPPQREEA